MEAAAIVNDLIRRMKERERLTDGQLAERLGIDRATLYRWRKGDIGKPASILIPLVAADRQEADTELIAA